MNLALRALRQLIKDNGFIYTDDIQTVEREYNLSANTVEGFLTEKCSVRLTGNPLVFAGTFIMNTYFIAKKLR